MRRRERINREMAQKGTMLSEMRRS